MAGRRWRRTVRAVVVSTTIGVLAAACGRNEAPPRPDSAVAVAVAGATQSAAGNVQLADTALDSVSVPRASTVNEAVGKPNSTGTLRDTAKTEVTEPAPVQPAPASGRPAVRGDTSSAEDDSAKSPVMAAPLAPPVASTHVEPAAAPPASTTPPVTPSNPSPPAWAEVPFDVGERFEYDVTFGPIKVGSSVMTVAKIDTIRGRAAYHTRFSVKGGTIVYKVNDLYESWVDAITLSSLRHHQRIDEGNYERDRLYEIYPERQVYVEKGKPEQKSVAQPLDDGSFIYFVRSLPLEVGKTYTLDRYFRPDRNPVTVQVLRKERVTVPAGTFNAIVVRPMIKTTGIFGEGGKAEIWLADDSTRMLLQLKSRLSVGSLNLYLRKFKKAP
jgi:hypothetical protein